MSSSAPANEIQTPTDPNVLQLYINNLSFSTTNDSLSAFLTDRLGVAPLVTNIIHRNGRHGTHSRGFGFVDIPKDKLTAALAISGTDLDGRNIGIVEAKMRTEEQRAEQREKRAAKQKERTAKRAADKATATANAPASDTTADTSNRADNGTGGSRQRPPRVERPTFPDSTQLYLNNLSFDVTADDVKKLFADTTGKEPLDVDIVVSKFGQFEGRSRGFGFVTVSKADEAAALALNGREYQGRDLGVVIARPRPAAPNGEQKEGGGGRRRPRGGRGGRGGGGDTNIDGDAAAANPPRRRVPNPADAEAAAAGQTDDATSAPPRRGGRRGGRRRGPRGGANAAAPSEQTTA